MYHLTFFGCFGPAFKDSDNKELDLDNDQGNDMEDVWVWCTLAVQDPEYVQDHWMKKRKRSEKEDPLRADRWYYKGMDEERDDPEQSGLY